MARVYAKHASNDKGEVFARLWETPEFREAFDYNQGYEKKGMLKLRIETIHRNTKMAQQLFQKVYYYPNLLEDDEVELRKRFITESATHDVRSTVLNWGLFVGFWPTLYFASKKFKGWPCVWGVSIAWYFLYKQSHRFNDGWLQSNLNSFAHPLVEKYNILDHHE